MRQARERQDLSPEVWVGVHQRLGVAVLYVGELDTGSLRAGEQRVARPTGREARGVEGSPGTKSCGRITDSRSETTVAMAPSPPGKGMRTSRGVYEVVVVELILAHAV